MKRVCNVLLAVLISALSVSAFAYKEGDQLSPEVMQRMQIDPEKLTIVDFFAEWCISCRIELPLISDLSQQLDQRVIEVIGVDVDEDEAVANAFQAELNDGAGLAFRVINDPSQFLIGAFEPLGMPAMYYIYQGQVIKVHIGAVPEVDQVIINDLREFGVL